jgi:predicted amidohydrolase
MGMSRNTVAAVQYKIGQLRSKNEFWESVKRHLSKARQAKANLVVFPEYLTGRLLSLAPAMSNAEACEYLHGFTHEYLERFSELSRKYGLTIVGGTHIHRMDDHLSETESSGGRRYFNESFLFFQDGRIGRQKKIHLTPEEQKAWPLAPGDEYAVFDTEAGKLAIQICYDIEFPEGPRISASLGAELIACPSYTDTAAGYWRVRNCAQARAIENQLFVAVSGIVGSMPEVAQVDAGYSQAGIFAPCDRPFPADGIIAQGAVNRSFTVCGDADLGLLRENRTAGGVAPFYDRKPALYDRYAKGVKASVSVSHSK